MAATSSKLKLSREDLYTVCRKPVFMPPPSSDGGGSLLKSPLATLSSALAGGGDVPTTEAKESKDEKKAAVGTTSGSVGSTLEPAAPKTAEAKVGTIVMTDFLNDFNITLHQVTTRGFGTSMAAARDAAHRATITNSLAVFANSTDVPRTTSTYIQVRAAPEGTPSSKQVFNRFASHRRSAHELHKDAPNIMPLIPGVTSAGATTFASEILTIKDNVNHDCGFMARLACMGRILAYAPHAYQAPGGAPVNLGAIAGTLWPVHGAPGAGAVGGVDQMCINIADHIRDNVTFRIFNGAKASRVLSLRGALVLFMVQYPGFCLAPGPAGRVPWLADQWKDIMRVYMIGPSSKRPNVAAGAGHGAAPAGNVTFTEWLEAWNWCLQVTSDEYSANFGLAAAVCSARFAGPEVVHLPTDPEHRWFNFPARAYVAQQMLRELRDNAEANMAAAAGGGAGANLPAGLVARIWGVAGIAGPQAAGGQAAVIAYADHAAVIAAIQAIGAVAIGDLAALKSMYSAVGSARSNAEIWLAMSSMEISAFIRAVEQVDIRALVLGNVGANFFAAIWPAMTNGANNHKCSAISIDSSLPVLGFEAAGNIPTQSGLAMFETVAGASMKAIDPIRPASQLVIDADRFLNGCALVEAGLRALADETIYGLRLSQSCIDASVNSFDTGNIDRDSAIAREVKAFSHPGYETAARLMLEAAGQFLQLESFSELMGGDLMVVTAPFFQHRGRDVLPMALHPAQCQLLLGGVAQRAGGFIQSKVLEPIILSNNGRACPWSEFETTDLSVADLWGPWILSLATSGIETIFNNSWTYSDYISGQTVHQEWAYPMFGMCRLSDSFPQMIHTLQPAAWYLASCNPGTVQLVGRGGQRMGSTSGTICGRTYEDGAVAWINGEVVTTYGMLLDATPSTLANQTVARYNRSMRTREQAHFGAVVVPVMSSADRLTLIMVATMAVRRNLGYMGFEPSARFSSTGRHDPRAAVEVSAALWRNDLWTPPVLGTKKWRHIGDAVKQ